MIVAGTNVTVDMKRIWQNWEVESRGLGSGLNAWDDSEESKAELKWISLNGKKCTSSTVAGKK